MATIKSKPKGKPRGKPWKPGESGNPAGRPKLGQTWAELIRELGDLDGPQAAARVSFLAAQFRKLNAGVTLKELVVLRVYAALIDEPNAGLLNSVMERAEGKVSIPIAASIEHETAVEAYDYNAAIAAICPVPEQSEPASG